MVSGHYVVVLTLEDTDYVCDYIRRGGDKRAFLDKFKGAFARVRSGRATANGGRSKS